MLTQALRDLETAYQNFFTKRAKYPRFRARHGAQSVRFAFDHRHVGKVSAWAKRTMVLPGIGECRIADSLEVWPQTPAMVTVRRDVCGDYWISYATEPAALERAPDRMIGVDVGITDLAVTSNAWKSGQLIGLRDKAAQLRRYQRRVSRRVKGSRRRRDAKRRLALAASANVVVIETLNLAGVVKNHNLARSLSDAAMSELHRQINYKVARRGGTVIRVNRWAPTSKVCSGCGHRIGEMPLSVRSWTCPECGSEHDRDVNAARNVLALGQGTASVRGDERGSGMAQALPVFSVEPRISAASRRRKGRQKAA